MAFAESLRSVSAQKDPKGVPAYTLYVNRRLGRLVAAAANELRLSPNQLTLASGLIALAGMGLLVLHEPTPLNSAAVGLLLALAYVFDSADGQLARLTGRSSAVGEWLDHLVDAAKHACLPLAIAAAALRFLDPSPLQVALPLMYQLVAVLTFSSMLLSDLLRRSESAPRIPPTRQEVRRAAFAKLPVDYGLVCVTVCLFGRPVFWWLYGVLLAFAILYFCVHVRVTLRRLDHLSADLAALRGARTTEPA